jgi:hypothetical protein
MRQSPPVLSSSKARVRPATGRAVMPGHEVNGRGFDSVAALTAQAAEQIFKGHIGLAFDQKPHGIADRLGNASNATRSRTVASPIAGASYEKGVDTSAIFEMGT